MVMSFARSRRMEEKLDSHLRRTARQLVKFDTLDETLHYLIESFWGQFACDYVSIILQNKDRLDVRISKGKAENFEQKFPLPLHACSDHYLSRPNCCHDHFEAESMCDFYHILTDEGFSTWFTVPIKESGFNSLGVCVIGFRQVVPLILNARNIFEEFGKDIASAIGMALVKENEKKKITGMELLKENVNFGFSVEQLVGNITERAGKGTQAQSASIYLYDEGKSCFLYQPPSYGPMTSPSSIQIEDNYHLLHYFPYLEREGGSQITVPLVFNLKTVGVLHVSNKESKPFTAEDLEFLQFLSSHVSVLIENARLYKSEREDKQRLEKLMVHHQELVKQTLVGEGFDEITETLAHMIGRTVVLFDRFMRPISSSLVGTSDEEWQEIASRLDQEKWKILHTGSQEHWIKGEKKHDFGMWKVIGGGDLLGYLGLKIRKKELDMVTRMTLNHALHVYAIQFIKQKLVLDVKEQVKDGFIHQLFVEKIEDKERLIEYANLFNVNIFQPNKIGVFSIECSQQIAEDKDLLTLEAQKTWVWETIRADLLQYDPGMMITRKEGIYLLIVPVEKEKEVANYWGMIYSRMQKSVSAEMKGIEIYLGISTSTKRIEDYYPCYRQALQALKIVRNRYPNKKFLRFDALGSYSVLYNLQDSFVAREFTKTYLDPLLHYGNGKGKVLFDTLRAYLMMNGNLKDTAEHLIIHRSSLKYRLEKIAELLDVNLEDAEERFNLMLAYMLYDLYELQD